MKVALPGKSDVLNVGTDPVLLSRMKGVHVDFDGKRVLYQAWIQVSDHNKLGPPMKNVIATDSFDIQRAGSFTSDGKSIECHVHRAVYHAAKHMYLVDFTCGLESDSTLKPTTISKQISTISTEEKETDNDSRGSFIEFD